MFLLLYAAMIGFQQGDSIQQIEFLRLSYKSNKDAFEFGAFRFEYTRGSSASYSEAEAGVFSKAVKEDGFYVFDGKNARYDLIADPKGLAAVTTRVGERKASSLASTFRMLTDGKVTLMALLSLDKSDTALFHGPPEIYPTASFFYDDAFFQFPLWIGTHEHRAFDLFHALSAIKDGRASLVELDFESKIDGIKVCKLCFDYKEGKCTYWIDVSRGCVPLRILNQYNRSDSSRSTFIFGDLEHVPNAGWLPRRRLRIIGDGAVVDRLVVTQIDSKNKPRLSVFQLDFPEPVRLVDRSSKLVHAQRKTWSLLNLPDRSSPGTRPAIPGTFIPPADLPGEIEAGPPWAIIVPVGVVVFLVFGSILILMRRRKRPQGA